MPWWRNRLRKIVEPKKFVIKDGTVFCGTNKIPPHNQYGRIPARVLFIARAREIGFSIAVDTKGNMIYSAWKEQNPNFAEYIYMTSGPSREGGLDDRWALDSLEQTEEIFFGYKENGVAYHASRWNL